MTENRVNQTGSGIKHQNWTGGNLEYLGRCPVCEGARRHMAHERLKDWVFDCSDDEWTLWRCESCATMYLDPRPDAASLGFAYRNYYTHDENIEPAPAGLLQQFIWSGINGYLNRRFGLRRTPCWVGGYWIFSILLPLRYKLDFYGRHLRRVKPGEPARRLLDVGCGSGAFLDRAREMGWSATGVDFDPKALDVCRAHGHEVYDGDLPSVPSSLRFDAITLNHTLEHLPDPLASLRQCRERLVSGGIVWITLPNPDSLGHRLLAESWRGLEPPRHLCLFPADCLAQMLRNTGFKDVKLMRRGVHSRKMLHESARITRKRELPGWSRGPLLLLQLTSDTLATLSPSRGEEITIVGHCG